MAYYPHAIETGARYQLVGPDGTTAVFNDPLDVNYVGMLSEVTGLDQADIRESAQELVEADGGTHGNFYFGRRPITMSGIVFNHTSVVQRNTRLDLARRASNALRGDATLTWRPSNRNENLILNPSVEPTALTNILNSTGQIGGTGTATLTRSTAQFQSGTASVQVAATNALNGVGFVGAPISSGRPYIVSFKVPPMTRNESRNASNSNRRMLARQSRRLLGSICAYRGLLALLC